MTSELARAEGALDEFWRAEGRRARLHVHIRGERAVDHGGARTCGLRKHDSGQRFRMLQRQRPAIVTGAIAPESVNGVITETWPARSKSMIPWHIGTSSWRGELVLITV